MSLLDNDSDLGRDGRKNTIEGEEGVEAEARDLIPARLISNLNELDIGKKLVDLWTQGNATRSGWLDRQQKMLQDTDEFMEPIYKGKEEWQSNIHLPIALTQIKTFHARMFSALLGQDPPFTAKARQSAYQETSVKIQNLMRYTIKSWANEGAGVATVVDDWLWDWASRGVGILKARWDRKFTKFEDIEQVAVPGQELNSENALGLTQVVPINRMEDRIVSKTHKVFEGPCIERIAPEDVLIIGGNGDPQKADHVIHTDKLTAHELSSLADQKVFKKEVVDDILSSGNDTRSNSELDNIKQSESQFAGLEFESDARTKRYEIIECYTKIDLDGSGIGSDLIVWVHVRTKQIVRATYLYRAMRTGKRPFFKIDFYRRRGQEYGIGLVELLWSLTTEIDAIHNIRIDTGMVTSIPWGFYDPQTSMRKEKLPISPGNLIPLANPQENVFFPNLGNRTSFALQEESLLNNMIERLTSINDLTLGSNNGQGAARTATGVNRLTGETNANLDIFLQRANIGWTALLQYLFHLLQQKLPPGFEFRLDGDDGKSYFETIKSREELLGMYDFELEANSSNSNPSIRLSNANQVYQMTQNPLDVQLGMIGPGERFEAIKGMLQAMGIKDWSRFVRKPDNAVFRFSPLELATRILHGVDVTLSPDQDLGGFIAWVDNMASKDEIIGQFSEDQVIALVARQGEAKQVLEAMKQAEAQVRNAQQIQANAALTTEANIPRPTEQLQVGGGEQ